MIEYLYKKNIIKTDLTKNFYISENDIIQTAYNFGYWCATGEKVDDTNDKLLK